MLHTGFNLGAGSKGQRVVVAGKNKASRPADPIGWVSGSPVSGTVSLSCSLAELSRGAEIGIKIRLRAR